MTKYAKLARNLKIGDRVVLQDGELATVTATKRSGLIQTTSGAAVEVFWVSEDGETGRALSCHPNDGVQVVEGTKGSEAIDGVRVVERRRGH